MNCLTGKLRCQNSLSKCLINSNVLSYISVSMKLENNFTDAYPIGLEAEKRATDLHLWLLMRPVFLDTAIGIKAVGMLRKARTTLLSGTLILCNFSA